MVQIHGIQQIKQRLLQFIGVTEKSIAEEMKLHAKEVQDFMRANAPWQNRTWEARNLLFADVIGVGEGAFDATSDYHMTLPIQTNMRSGIVMVLHGDSDHNLILEVRSGGRFAIIGPTFEREQGKMVEIAKRGIARVK